VKLLFYGHDYSVASELEKEICWSALEVSFDRTLGVFREPAVDFGEVGIEDHFLSADLSLPLSVSFHREFR